MDFGIFPKFRAKVMTPHTSDPAQAPLENGHATPAAQYSTNGKRPHNRVGGQGRSVVPTGRGLPPAAAPRPGDWPGRSLERFS